MKVQSPELVAKAVKLHAAGMTYAAIAGACGITKGAVAGMLFRAGACKRERPAAKSKPEVAAAPRAPRPPPRLLPSGGLQPGLTCSWPAWSEDTPRRERAYCGCQTGGPGMSYCVEHWRMAYPSAREMVRV